MFKRKYKYPIRIIVYFNLFTVLLFAFGPWQFRAVNKTMTVLFVVLCNVTLYIGYSFRINSSGTLNYISNDTLISDINIKILKKWTYIGLLLSIPDFIYNTRLFSSSPREIINRIIIGFTNSYQNYSTNLSYVNSGTVGESLFIHINVLLYFFKFSVLPLSILYWSKISKSQKRMCVFITILEFFKWIAKGMNKGIFDLVIILFASLLIKIMSTKGDDWSIRKLERKELKRIYLVIGILVIGAITMFTMNSISRTQRTTISYYSASTATHADPDNFILNLFPNALKRGVLSFSMYLTEGYNGLSYALTLPYKFCGFVGHSMFLLTNFQDLLGIRIWENTYMVSISQNYNWDSLVNWHSLYSWIGNDIPFIFMPLAFLLIGMIFAAAWRDAIKYRNPYAVLVVVLFFIEFFYSSANNQIGALAYTSMAWYISLFMWRYTRRRYVNYANAD